MYKISFQVGDTTLTKTALTEKDVKRIVYIYSAGNTEQKNAQITAIVSQKEANEIKEVQNEEKKLKNKKILENGNL